MQIKLNGEAHQLDEAVDVATLVRRATGREDGEGTAVAVNGEVVSRSQWQTVKLNEGDDVELLQAVAGG